jgi:hypothetical protein
MITQKKKSIVIIVMIIINYIAISDTGLSQATTIPFAPGEKLKYALRWENIPAGELQLEIHPITTINAAPAYHFVLVAKSNAAVDLFFKVRDRIDAYANTQMTRSEFYQKKQTGRKKERNEQAVFDWLNNKVQYTDSGLPKKPVELLPGSFDPLSAFYYTRMAISEKNTHIELPVTDGKKNIIGKARITGRETITLKSGNHYDTFVLEPDISLFGGVFKDSNDAKLRVWVTTDKRRIPVQIKAKVKVGHFIGELISAKGV